MTRGVGEGGVVGKQREESSQGTSINDPRTWTTGQGLTVTGRGGAVESNRGKNWGNYNRKTVKKVLITRKKKRRICFGN